MGRYVQPFTILSPRLRRGAQGCMAGWQIKLREPQRKTGIRGLTAAAEGDRMKHLLTGVAVVAALAFAAPVWAQPANPSGGNAMGMPGPNPGGGGLTPYTTGPGPKPSGNNYIPPSAPPAAMAPSAAPAPSEMSSATPPSHRHARHASHKMAAHHGGKATQLTGTSANQLNQEELARLQAGDLSNPPVEPSNPLPPSPAPTSGGRMSTGGRATSTAPTH